MAALIVACACLLLAPGTASAGTLDQQQPTGTGGGAILQAGTFSAAQTFTAGITGALDEVDLSLKKVNTPAPFMSVEIRDVSGGVPGGQILDSVNLPASSVPVSLSFGWVPIHFASPAQVVAGTQYAIVAYSLSSGVNAYAWEVGPGNSYAAGSSFQTSSIPPNGGWAPFGGSGDDFAFKTYVVPAPSAAPAASSSAPTGERAAALAKCRHKHGAKRKRCRKRAKKLPV